MSVSLRALVAVATLGGGCGGIPLLCYTQSAVISTQSDGELVSESYSGESKMEDQEIELNDRCSVIAMPQEIKDVITGHKGV
ncbi:hypothetical protein OVS_02500 [Mycoplasma ovis str. Michigan]|uniref:Lipoprotein n=1 Tax=Mycoplasma ovis str. Michigan TaxID=1415773 RepID=A0ABM5P1L1_9MOLU|nr:hypothetical protein [Mycoplasma ovis]AHC40338.1 hypothetical protein OVS_02500 [Mycoplasma ovis str. Michigan]